MRWRNGLACAVIVGAAASLAAQQPQQTQQTTTSTTTTKSTTVSGEVVQYEPGKTIVIRDPNSRMTTYTLDPGLAVPAEVQVGRRVTIYSSPVDGSIRVQKIITTQTTGPDGTSSATTRVRDEPASSQEPRSEPMSGVSAAPAQESPSSPAAETSTTTTTKTTRVVGTVQAYQPGQSITIVGPSKKTTTYVITTDSQMPSDVVVGKQVTIETSVVGGKPVARTVTSKTTTKVTKTKSISPQ